MNLLILAACALGSPTAVTAFVAMRRGFGGVALRQPQSFHSQLASSSLHEDDWDTSFSEETPIGVDALDMEDAPDRWEAKVESLPKQDPGQLEIADSKVYETEAISMAESMTESSNYPMAMMMQDCGPFIASHAGKTVVFHIPGTFFEDSARSESLLSDIVIAYLLGMKIVLVVASEFDLDICPMDFTHSHECHNALTIVNQETLRAFEEEAGFLRTEIERKINRCLHKQGNGNTDEGNIVSGNFYTARRYGRIRGEDFEYAGYVGEVHVKNINNVLKDNDIVLLSTVGLCRMGDLVNVNGYHLAASVASSLNAYKLVYMANEGSILHEKGGGQDDIIQELPLSYAQDILAYHDVKIHPKGFAHFEQAFESLDPRAVELLLHLGWASWALEHGVTRAHIVNPTDGALLEELFTSKNGANTCLFHDDELTVQEDDVPEEAWDDFFQSARLTGANGMVATFG